MSQPINIIRIILGLSLISALSVGATEVRECKDKPFPLSVNIADCDVPPCLVYKGTFAVMEVHFLGNNNNIKNITATTTAKVWGISTGYDLPEEISNVCINLLYGAMCPIDKDEDVTYQFNFYVDPIFPEVTADVTVNLNDDKGESITCFVVSCKIRKGATAAKSDSYLLD
ncbi:hypothetical protein KR067_011875 [Drosophila pandora]|nr:hypothetical protein KR067_011875 [Drosophila pandora]